MSKRKSYYPTQSANDIMSHAVRKSEKVGIEKGMMFTLAVVLNLLIEDYWKKTAPKRVPKLAEDVVNLIDAIQCGVVDVEDCVDYVEKATGMKFQADWIRHTGQGANMKKLKGE